MGTGGQPEGDGSKRVIKRYANRKLYDTRDSRYVTLQQIAEYVRAGEDVAIIDNTSKEDLTNVTLAQIIYEEEKGADANRALASVGTLRQLIQESGEKLMTSLREGPVGKLIARKEDQTEGHDEGPEDGDETPLEAIGEPPSGPSVEQLAAEVRALRERVRRLEQRLSSSPAAAARETDVS